jgi:DNA repair ATPase RecN
MLYCLLGVFFVLALGGCSKPESKLVNHVEALDEILEDHEDEPKEGLIAVRKYLRKNLPTILELMGEIVVELDELEDADERKERLESFKETLEEPMKSLSKRIEKFVAAVARDQEAMEYLKEMSEQWQALQMVLDGAQSKGFEPKPLGGRGF